MHQETYEERGPARPRGTDSVEIVKVIKTKALCGRGTDSDPVFPLVQYWDFDGNLIGEDPPGRRIQP